MQRIALDYCIIGRKSLLFQPLSLFTPPFSFLFNFLWCDKMKVEQDIKVRQWESEREQELCATLSAKQMATFNCICFSGFKSVKFLCWKLSATSTRTCASEPLYIEHFDRFYLLYLLVFFRNNWIDIIFGSLLLAHKNVDLAACTIVQNRQRKAHFGKNLLENVCYLSSCLCQCTNWFLSTIQCHPCKHIEHDWM